MKMIKVSVEYEPGKKDDCEERKTNKEKITKVTVEYEPGKKGDAEGSGQKFPDIPDISIRQPQTELIVGDCSYCPFFQEVEEEEIIDDKVCRNECSHPNHSGGRMFRHKDIPGGSFPKWCPIATSGILVKRDYEGVTRL